MVGPRWRWNVIQVANAQASALLGASSDLLPSQHLAVLLPRSEHEAFDCQLAELQNGHKMRDGKVHMESVSLLWDGAPV